MKKQLLYTFFLVAALLLVAMPAHAQEPQPGQIVSINKPISAELRAALDAWLLDPPSAAVYYAVTYTQPIGEGTYVSMVGLNIQNPEDEWSIAGDEFGKSFVMWMDTVLVDETGAVSYPFSQGPTASAIFKMAAPIAAPLTGAGGGAYVRFPWQPAKAVQFGVLGIHASEFGLDGSANDLVSGSDMGSGAANDSVYASVGGTVNYICDYGDTVAVRLTGGGDSFLYAHLNPNANLVLDHSFSSGQKMGQLKHGTFTDECGNAFQQDDHWHLHWGFLMSGGKFQAEGCILTGSGPLAKWKCGNTETKVYGFLYHYGNIGTNPETGTVGAHSGEGAGGGPSFWDYFLEGAGGILSQLITSRFPDHDATSNVFIYSIMNSVKIVFRIVNVLIRGNLNLVPAATVVVIAITINIGLSALTLAGYIIRILKSIPFVP